MSILENQPHQTKPNSTTPNQTHLYQIEIKHTKPNSCIPNQIQLQQTKLINTKPDSSSIPIQTQAHQAKLIHAKPNNTDANQSRQFPNWLGMHSRTISSFCLLLAILFTRVILQNIHLINFLSPGIAERSSAIQKYNFWQNE